MSSLTISFTGNTSRLQANFFPEIILDSNSNYYCGLLDFTTYNTIPNIIENQNNQFKYKQNGTDEKTITLSTGAYEAEEILTYLKEQFAVNKITLTYGISATTSKIRIAFNTDIEWTGGTILNVLGFFQKNNNNQNKSRIFKKTKEYFSDSIVKISSINLIRINCDLVTDSYINGLNSHTIHQFAFGKIETGYKYIEIPRHIIYLPIKQRRLQTIQISIVDENGNLIDFRGEEISCRIHIKKS